MLRLLFYLQAEYYIPPTCDVRLCRVLLVLVIHQHTPEVLSHLKTRGGQYSGHHVELTVCHLGRCGQQLGEKMSNVMFTIFFIPEY